MLFSVADHRMLWLRPIEATQILSSFLNADVDRYDGGAEKFWPKSTSARAMLFRT
jgi:hypothetical protein